eukprot:1145798-Pyramimonas_sp.AAC.1
MTAALFPRIWQQRAMQKQSSATARSMHDHIQRLTSRWARVFFWGARGTPTLALRSPCLGGRNKWPQGRMEFGGVRGEGGV